MGIIFWSYLWVFGSPHGRLPLLDRCPADRQRESPGVFGGTYGKLPLLDRCHQLSGKPGFFYTCLIYNSIFLIICLELMKPIKQYIGHASQKLVREKTKIIITVYYTEYAHKLFLTANFISIRQFVSQCFGQTLKLDSSQLFRLK